MRCWPSGVSVRQASSSVATSIRSWRSRAMGLKRGLAECSQGESRLALGARNHCPVVRDRATP